MQAHGKHREKNSLVKVGTYLETLCRCSDGSPCSTWWARTKVFTLKNRLYSWQACSVHSKCVVWLHSREGFWPKWSSPQERVAMGSMNLKKRKFVHWHLYKVCLPSRMISQERPTWKIMKLSFINLVESFVIRVSHS